MVQITISIYCIGYVQFNAALAEALAEGVQFSFRPYFSGRKGIGGKS